MRTSIKNIIVTMREMSSDYRIHRKKDSEGHFKEYVTTEEGPLHCLGVSGLAQIKLEHQIDPQYWTLQVGDEHK